MRKSTATELIEGFSLAGTFLFKSKEDAEGIAQMLGLEGAFPSETNEGLFWSPGKNHDQLMQRILSNYILPSSRTQIPQTHLRESFRRCLDIHGDKYANL